RNRCRRHLSPAGFPSAFDPKKALGQYGFGPEILDASEQRLTWREHFCAQSNSTLRPSANHAEIRSIATQHSPVSGSNDEIDSIKGGTPRHEESGPIDVIDDLGSETNGLGLDCGFHITRS